MHYHWPFLQIHSDLSHHVWVHFHHDDGKSARQRAMWVGRSPVVFRRKSLGWQIPTATKPEAILPFKLPTIRLILKGRAFQELDWLCNEVPTTFHSQLRETNQIPQSKKAINHCVDVTKDSGIKIDKVSTYWRLIQGIKFLLICQIANVSHFVRLFRMSILPKPPPHNHITYVSISYYSVVP